MLLIATFLILQTIILAALILMFFNKQTSVKPMHGRKAFTSVVIFIILLLGYAHGLSRIFNHFLEPSDAREVKETAPVVTNIIEHTAMEQLAAPEAPQVRPDPSLLAAARAKIKVHAIITMQSGKSCAMVENRIIREGETINVTYRDQVYTWRFLPGPDKADPWASVLPQSTSMALTQKIDP